MSDGLHHDRGFTKVGKVKVKVLKVCRLCINICIRHNMYVASVGLSIGNFRIEIVPINTPALAFSHSSRDIVCTVYTNR